MGGEAWKKIIQREFDWWGARWGEPSYISRVLPMVEKTFGTAVADGFAFCVIFRPQSGTYEMHVNT